MPAHLPPHRSRLHHFTAVFFRRILRHTLSRKVVCLTLILTFLTTPAPGWLLQDLPQVAAHFVALASAEAKKLPDLLKSWLMRPTPRPRQETIAERNARVVTIELSPAKFVGYQDQPVAFSAFPTDVFGEPVQGVKFTWEAEDPQKAQIDDAGRATFLQPGLTWIVCRAGFAEGRAPVLIRPGRRPAQTDAQWHADQNSLSASGTTVGGALGWLPALAGKLAPTASAQNNSGPKDYLWNDPRNLTGAPPNRAIESTRIGPVLPEGANFHHGIPIVSLGGRGLAASLTLYYNSRVWARDGSAVVYSPVEGFPRAGFRLGFGHIETYLSSYPPYDTGYLLIEADGTPRYLGHGSATNPASYQTNDGTHIRFTGSASNGGTLTYKDGTTVTISVVNNRLLPTRIRDRNGNYLQVAYKDSAQGYSPFAINYVTDTLGRQIQFTYDASLNLTAITAPAFGTGTRTLAQFNYENKLFRYTFSGVFPTNAPPSGSAISTLRRIYFPATGTGYLLTYSDYGMVYTVSRRRAMSSLSTDYGTESASVTFNYPTSGTTVLTDSPAFTQRVESAVNSLTATYTYTTATVGQTKVFTVTRPDYSQVLLTRSTDAASVANGLLVETEIKSGGGASMAKTQYAYANDPGGSPQVQAATSYDDLGTPTKVDYSYNAYGSVTNFREYGHQVSGLWQVRRRTRTVYTAIGGAVDLVTEVNVYDALLNTSDGDDVMIAKTTYTYDNYAAMGGMENYGGTASPPGHLASYNASYTTRGNVTGVTRWYDLANNLSITRLNKYDIFGNVVKEQLSCCNEKIYTCAEATCWAQPEQITTGSGTGSLTTTMEYDFNTGAVKTQTDPNSLQTTYGYDAALRPNSTTLPTTASQTMTYNDGQMQVSRTVNYTEGGSPRAVTSTETLNGWGQQTQMVAGGGQVNTSYDNMGRVASRTNPFPPGGAPGPATAYAYDALGRLTVTTLPDSNTVQHQYSGNTVTVIDQVNRKIKRETDGLGR
ncbi:MAG TPA: hypothetical protein VNO70_15285, partial [Blastocatellia bacterium]|nr:hypothetical protein [Blastocatellia bacterium]